jgi:DNA polymerase-3 subunit gamma/tau
VPAQAEPKPINTQASTQKTAEPKPEQKTVANDNNDWPAMISAMKIGGMTRELANNCVIDKIDDQVCTLLLDPGHKQLLGDVTEQKLHKAIQQYLGKSIKLLIEVRAVDHDTPSVQINRERQERQSEAEQAINEDENIRALKEKFDARVIPGTIEPL